MTGSNVVVKGPGVVEVGLLISLDDKLKGNVAL